MNDLPRKNSHVRRGKSKSGRKPNHRRKKGSQRQKVSPSKLKTAGVPVDVAVVGSVSGVNAMDVASKETSKRLLKAVRQSKLLPPRLCAMQTL
ncbi:MAG: hypothetical protein AAB241_01135 [Pseudomonadota bacterium]